MRPVRMPIIKSDERMDKTVTYGSLKLFVDTSYRPEHHRRQWGTVVGDFKDLKDGDKVYFHYLSLVDNPHIPPDKWLVPYEMIYCIIRDEVIMLNDYLAVSILQEESNSKLITLKKKSTNKGVVKYTNHPDLITGDEVYFNKMCAFENEIEGDTVYMMENRDILKVKR